MSAGSGLSLVSEIGSERRTNVRFPITLSLRYWSPRPMETAHGNGKSVNLSSNGVLFVSEHEFVEGDRLELALDWPATLAGAVPLQLFLVGKVVRADGRQIAVAIHHHEFRTARRQTSDDPSPQVKWMN
jgi:hypothetical protein